jgi:hypothetical protein
LSGWAILAIVLGIGLIAGALGAAGYFGWRLLERRLALRLVVRTEAVEAVVQALDDTAQRLAAAGDDELAAFSQDPDSAERRALHEVASRAGILRDELDVMRLPKAMIPIAEALGDVAYLAAKEAGSVTDQDTGHVALEKLGSLDLGKIRDHAIVARSRVSAMCAEYGLEDTAVYGGGLYL